jgi:hypothetical protein
MHQPEYTRLRRIARSPNTFNSLQVTFGPAQARSWQHDEHPIRCVAKTPRLGGSFHIPFGTNKSPVDSSRERLEYLRLEKAHNGYRGTNALSYFCI